MRSGRVIRAVVFDLWETLIDWDRDAAARMVSAVEELVGPGFAARWEQSPNRYVAPIRTALSDAGVPAAVMDDVCEIRSHYTRGSIVPRPGAVETLRRLRELEIAVGLITVCSEDVERVWPETDFAGLFDAEVFSSREGIAKPDPQIYLRCCERLGVEPHEAVFVGDGANDELAGARRVGMEAVLIHPPGEDPAWPELQTWDGLRVTSIPEVLEVLELC